MAYSRGMETRRDDHLFKQNEHQEAWRQYLESYRRVIDALDDELRAQRGLSLVFYDVLVQLYRAPERRLRMNLLAGSVLLSKSGLTRLIDRMEAEGLVERCSCPGDRRGSYAVLTPRGEQVFTDAAPVHLEGIERHFTSHLSSREAKALVSAFEKINAAQRAGAVQARSHSPG